MDKHNAQHAALPPTANRTTEKSATDMIVRPQDGEMSIDESRTIDTTTTKNQKAYVEALPTDIICGRGARVSHPGNQRFRQIVLQRKSEYQRAKRREEKTRITSEIVNILLGGTMPARFLLKDPDTDLFFDVGIEYAKEKVSHALRSRPNAERRHKKKILATAKNQNNNNRKHSCPPELENMVSRLITAQQQLLEAMIQREVIPSSTSTKRTNHEGLHWLQASH